MILFNAFFFTVPSPPDNVQKCLNLPYLVWYIWQRSHFKNRWSICCVWIPHSLHRMWVCSSGTALNLSYSCGGVFWLGRISPPHLNQCFTILWAIILILLHARRRIFRRLKPPAPYLFMQYWVAFSLTEVCCSPEFKFSDSFLQNIVARSTLNEMFEVTVLKLARDLFWVQTLSLMIHLSVFSDQEMEYKKVLRMTMKTFKEH